MPQDTYEREDNRTLCDRIGHRYKEISSRVKRWSVEEEYSLPSGSSTPWGDDSTNPETGTVRSSARVHYKADIVTYRCANCGDMITKTENERLDE